MTTTPDICTTCKRPIRNERGCGPYCSEFCAIEPGDVIDAFLAAKPGDFCVFPCAECGCSVEGDWSPDPHKGICADCANKVRLRERTAVLREALPLLPDDLRKRAEEALSW